MMYPVKKKATMIIKMRILLADFSFLANFFFMSQLAISLAALLTLFVSSIVSSSSKNSTSFSSGFILSFLNFI